MATKESRRLGKLGGPIECDRVLVRDMVSAYQHVHGQSWILIRGNQKAHLNSYNGNLGNNVSTVKWRDFDDKKLEKHVRDGYEEVPVESCPLQSGRD